MIRKKCDDELKRKTLTNKKETQEKNEAFENHFLSISFVSALKRTITKTNSQIELYRYTATCPPIISLFSVLEVLDWYYTKNMQSKQDEFEFQAK